MTKEKYIEMVIERFPDFQTLVEFEGVTLPSLLKTVAIELFLEGEVETELAEITRYQLYNLNVHGVLEFDDDN